MFKQQTYSGKKRKNIMVSVRFSCLLIALLLTVCHSIARPHQGESRKIGRKIYGQGEKISYQGSSDAVRARYKNNRSRKLMENGNNTEEEELKEIGSNGEIDRKFSNIRILEGINGLKSKNNKRFKSSKHSIKKKSSKHSQRVKSLLPEEMDIDSYNGFVAFNADYRPPRHHPPKNN